MIQPAWHLLLEAGAIPKAHGARIVRQAVEAKERVCLACEHYGRLSDMALPFEIAQELRQGEERVCTHVNGPCWRSARRRAPWRLAQCPAFKF